MYREFSKFSKLYVDFNLNDVFSTFSYWVKPGGNFMSNWMIVVPPEGAAREVAVDFSKHFQSLHVGQTIYFDCKNILQVYDEILTPESRGMSLELFNQTLVCQVLEKKIDFVLVCATSPITKFALSILNDLPVKLIHWFYEDYRRVPYWKDTYSFYDYFLCVQEGEIKEIINKSPAQYQFFPTAAASVNIPPSLEKKWDLCFIGIPSSYRVGVLEYIKQNSNTNLYIAGAHWDKYQGGILRECIHTQDWVTPEVMCETFQQSHLVLNLSFHDPAEDRENCQISPRVFDVFNSGSWLITESLPLMTLQCDQYSYSEFKALEELPQLIQSLLDKKESLTQEVNQNKFRAQVEHTYKHRAQRMLDLVKE